MHSLIAPKAFETWQQHMHVVGVEGMHMCLMECSCHRHALTWTGYSIACNNSEAQANATLDLGTSSAGQQLWCSHLTDVLAELALPGCLCVVLDLQEVKIKVVTAGDNCFVRMLAKDSGEGQCLWWQQRLW
jgi:hypothetical protein